MGNKLRYRHVQESVETIDRFVEHGIPPGGFIYAVLTNNLKESFMRADTHNREYLFDIVSYCYNEIPAAAWGSVEKYNEWGNEVRKQSKAKNENQGGSQQAN